MSNKQLLLAYSTTRAMSTAEIQARIYSATAHLSKIVPSLLKQHESHSGNNGIVGWTPADDLVSWPVVSMTEQGSAGWLHIPTSNAPGHPSAPVEYAFHITHGKIERWRVGAPFACATLSPSGELRIANDVLGLARLYCYEFDNMTIWSSRPGLAHVFAGQSPNINRVAWHSMATLGWPIRGTTLMGKGRQLPAYTLERVNPAGLRETANQFTDWLSDFNSQELPTMGESAESIKQVLHTTRLWPSPPIADLSGGKDSRVIAAAAITSGVTTTVRTRRTDYGEVDTAQELVQASPVEIEHLIEDDTPPPLTEGGVETRLLSQHRIWEGHYLAKSMYKAGIHPGIKGRTRARLNGLGGEALQGGALMGGNWRKRINAGGQRVALERLERLVTNPKATSDEAREVTTDRLLNHARLVREFGWAHPEAPINFIYSTDRMPHWSLPLAGRSTIVPFFAPSMLLHMAGAMREPREYGEIHKELLSSLSPSWANVPFYTPSAKTRATKFMWEYQDWEEARALIEERHEQTESYVPASIRKVVNTVQYGDGTSAEENALMRILWEISFHDYLDEITRDVMRTNQAVSKALSAQEPYGHRQIKKPIVGRLRNIFSRHRP